MQRIFLSGAVFLLSACVFQPEGEGQKAEFHPPLVYAQWEASSGIDAQGKPICIISSGISGLTVSLGPGQEVAVRSDRPLPPGAFLAVNVNGHRYQASVSFFPADDAARLVDDLAAGDKAYLEWSELRGDDHSRIRFTNILRLDGFRQQRAHCPALLKGL